MKQKLQNAKKQLMQTLPTILSVIAVLAITWSILSFFDKMTYWWSFLLIAIITGVIGILLPKIAHKIRPFYSITSAGISLLLIESTFEFIPKGLKFLVLLTILAVISLLTDLLFSYQTTSGDILFDVVLSIVATCIISFFSVLIITLPILLILYSLVILIQFDFRFSFKKREQTVSPKE